MKSIIKKIEQFILSNTVWMPATVLLFFSTVLTNGSVDKNWASYLSFVLILSLLFVPILLFNAYRNWLTKKLNNTQHRLLWLFCFIAYPMIIGVIGLEDIFPVENVNIKKWSLLIVGGSLLITEGIVQSRKYLFPKFSKKRWFKKISLEKSILVCMLLFSIAMFTFNNIFSEENTGLPINYTVLGFTSNVIQLFIILFIYYCFYWVNHYFLISKLFKQKGFVYYAFGFAATLFLFFPIAAEIISWLPIVSNDKIHPVADGFVFSGEQFIIPFFGMALTTPLIVAVQWFKQNIDLAALEKEKSETELNLLKQQINPHFFFNTLNNLYALSLTKDEKTPEVILQLSELMRYVIKKGKESQVALAEEIKYIEDYIWLQQIRLHKKLDFKFEKNIEDKQLKVPPLLFINLVENAFKHGIEPAENDCFLHIYIKSKNGELLFICENSFEEKPDKNSGMGLNNLKRRLELRFPEQHEFNIEENKNSYKATLKIKL